VDSSVRRKLIDELARLYRAHSSVQSLLDAAGIRSQALIAWSEKPRDTWNAILNHLEVQEQVQALLDVVIDEYPQDGIFHQARYQTLLEPASGVRAPDIPSHPLVGPGAAEALMGAESALLPILFLRRGLECARSVARTIKDSKTASGFLTDSDVFITNNHVIDSPAEASQTVLEFGYDALPGPGGHRQFTAVMLRPESGFLTDAEDDITLVRAEEGASAGWGSIPVAPLDLSQVRYVNIIQHPRGGAKMIGLYHNVLAHHDSRIIDY
jgi:S1-C subfamily serine protease